MSAVKRIMMRFGNAQSVMEYQELVKMAETCPDCLGAGYVQLMSGKAQKCFACNGSGEI